MDQTSATPANAVRSWPVRFLQFPLTRIILALLMVGMTVNFTFALARLFVPDKSMRIMWPALLATVLCFGVYHLYVRLIEKRDVVELSWPKAGRELAVGILCGMLLISVVMGVLFGLGVYQITGMNSWTVMIVPIAELILVALLEEVLFRAILFRIIEKSLGTWIAIIVSSILFAVAHLPNEGISLLAVVNVTVAGLLFAGAYLATRRLWLPIGIHFAWNYCLGEVFSIAVSGHPAQGLLAGKLDGADWITGGVFGVEASAITPVVILMMTLCFIAYARKKAAFMLPFWKIN